MISETLRHEMIPFGIKVFDLKTGQVTTNFFNNIANNDMATKLPPDSIYQVAREKVEQVMSGDEFMAAGDTPENWATNVVKDLTKANPSPHIFRGKNAKLAALLHYYMPTWFSDGEMRKFSGINVVEKKVKEEKKQN
jgi:1-acylglycerone phosphate reductase